MQIERWDGDLALRLSDELAEALRLNEGSEVDFIRGDGDDLVLLRPTGDVIGVFRWRSSDGAGPDE